MSFVTSVRRVIELAQERQAADEDARRSSGLNHGGALAVQHVGWLPEEATLGTARLDDYLRTLPEPDLLKIRTLMYFGRGDDSDITALHKYLVSSPETKAEIAHSVAEKVPLADYLKAGLALAEQSGVDLEQPFGCVVQMGNDALPGAAN